MKRLAPAALAVLIAAACWTSKQAADTTTTTTTAPDLPPLPRSSLAAVLLHRDELHLSDEQVKAFQNLDEDLAEHEKAMLEKPSGGPRPDAGAGSGSGAAHGMGKGKMRSFGGRGGGGAPGGTAGGGYRGSSSGQPKGFRSIEERLDDIDTRAYLQAEEEILDPGQRDRAREIAEKYREDLYDRRARAAAERSGDR